jgi:ABC-type lipoprotein export system ATPase subunit
VDGLQERLKQELEGHTYEDLKKQATGSQVKPRRLAITISGERGRAEGKLDTNEHAIQENQKRLGELVKKYKTQGRLFNLLVDKRAEMRELDRKLQKLKPLPKSIKDPEDFIKNFERKRDVDLPNEKKYLADILVKQAELQARAPEETPEEIEVRLREAQLAFEQIELKANALAQIRTVFEQIKLEKDTQTLNPWLEELGRVLEPLTADRYNKIEWAEDDNSKAIRKDGQEIPFDLLSTGTKVGLGLALRLSMARYFLVGLRGFLVMDDPLVDIDPERQSAAAKVIQNFARDKQVIIVTCHPSHAELLGGHVIHL